MTFSIGKSRRMPGFMNSMRRLVFFPGISLQPCKIMCHHFEQVWGTYDFDAIIGPGLASPALVHK